MAILSVHDLTVTFPETERPVLHNIHFELEAGDFAVLCGETGCGKSTLLRMCKRELRPLCDMTGEVRYQNTPLDALDSKTSAAEIGFVMQHPEQQIVTDRVWHELAFGLENMGMPLDTMHRRIAEIASYFGMEPLLDRDPALLSGGQKQLLNLASVMVMQPKLLLLDEPTAQLDPIAASDFLTTLRRLNQDLSVTILLVEHRLEEVIPLANKLLIMGRGTLDAAGSPRDILHNIRADAPVLGGMPAAVRLHRAVHADGVCPLSVCEARRDLMPQLPNQIRALPAPPPPPETPFAAALSGVFFRYQKQAQDVLRDLSMNVREGEFYCLIGGNGAGKSTVLSVLAGVRKAYAGKISIFGKRIESYKNRSLHQKCAVLLPQDVQTVFLCNSVREELAEVRKDYENLLADFPFDLSPLLPQHPYDLSGGEQQIAALAKVMLAEPRLLLLDEPTKGLDAAAKSRLADVLHGLTQKGVTVLTVTHDIEFAAEHADRCGFLSRGALISADIPRRFFAENAFYTTAVSRITRGFYDNAVTLDDAVSLVKQNQTKI